ncbi:MAG TPA: hypothetical protein PLF04_09105 [Candidatus Fermentibacter daniensis]|nr:MAG: hypothetical protein AO396_04855 [Candidatus Fermentibacter daniensis]MBP7719766.1 hypothetical protein [Candidatus Fermentibacter sp.]OQC68208.1 MAG: hypothetical protein BWX47_01927 [candidate division Hyd24-12 bacterium ADurb.Bin004]MCC6871121.1 hypothetical protein [Candidatus Fermentibacter sp.]NLI02404.1 hypothetical protein [Candidatus Fermentibacter daniensis]
MPRASSVILLCAVLLAAGCEGIRNEAETRQCRANLNTLSTEQALFRSTFGRWADDIHELDGFAKRTVPLVCPSCGEGYDMEVDPAGGYTLACPCGEHGSIVTGTTSWAVEPRRRRS